MFERSKTALAGTLLLFGCGGGGAAQKALDHALQSLRDGDLRAAEASAERAAARGGPEYAALRDFLHGNVAFVRCVEAGRQASTPAAEPFAWDVALLYGRKARDFWQRAAVSRADWPAARRNVERALLKLEELERKKADAEDRRRRASDPQPRPRPLPKPRQPDPDPEQGPPDGPQLKELGPEQVLQLLEKLAQKEREKLALRRSQRKAGTAGVEKDW